MGKTPYNAPPNRQNDASRIKRNPTFKNNNNRSNQEEGGERVQRKPRNQLKLNEFHQTVRTKHKQSYKKKMRDINRLLNAKAKKEEIDPALKEQKEQQLKDLKKKHRESRKKRFLIQENEHKYKKIKFFEEQKLKRRLKSIQNKLKKLEEEGEEDSENTREKLEKEKERIGEDLNYIKYYPLDKKYVALFPTVDDESAKEKREIMRKQIKEIMAKKAINFKKSLERLTNSLNEEGRNAKMDTFFETEEVEQKAPKKKIVDKTGRIIDPDNFF